MPPKFVAILEDDLPRTAAMRRMLADALPTYNVIVFATAPAMMMWLDEHLKDVVLISLDHDLPPHGGTGREVAEYLACRRCTCPVIVHTSNSAAAPGMMRVLREAGWICSYVTPHDDLAWIVFDWQGEIEQYHRRGWIFD